MKGSRAVGLGVIVVVLLTVVLGVRAILIHISSSAECEARGGIYNDEVCLEKDSVIPL